MGNQIHGQQSAAPAKSIDVYGVVSCERPGNASVSERFGRKSIAAIQCKVPVLATGMVIDATIWGRLEIKSDGTTIRFEASVPKGVKIPESADAERFLAHVERSAMSWLGYDAATTAAERLLLGGTKGDKDSARPVMVRLVKASGTQQPQPTV